MYLRSLRRRGGEKKRPVILEEKRLGRDDKKMTLLIRELSGQQGRGNKSKRTGNRRGKREATEKMDWEGSIRIFKGWTRITGDLSFL